jgi:hypothetical protein
VKLDKGQAVRLRVMVVDPEAAGKLLASLVDTMTGLDTPTGPVHGLKLSAIGDDTLFSCEECDYDDDCEYCGDEDCGGECEEGDDD